MKGFLSLVLLVACFVVSSCVSADETVVGRYALTTLDYSECDPVSQQLKVLDQEGVCRTEDGVYRCLIFTLDFTESSMIITLTGTEDGTIVFNFQNATFFDPVREDIDFCLPSGDCNQVSVSTDKERLNFWGTDSDNGCNFWMVMTRMN